MGKFPPVDVVQAHGRLADRRVRKYGVGASAPAPASSGVIQLQVATLRWRRADSVTKPKDTEDPS